ncbi:CHRromatin Organization MOdifier domain-containing protein [Balamuthia mandrillaris]
MEEATKKKVIFHVTGFGKFQGVASNPTTCIIQELPRYLEENPLTETAAEIKSMTVLETSGVGSLCSLSELHLRKNRLTPSEQERTSVVWLHLGVACSQNDFKLERVAWNEAHFRCCDEREWRPCHQPIYPEHGSTEHYQTTDIPVYTIQEQLKQLDFDVQISEDPGRFVCNWIYYHSLHFSSLDRCSSSLFVHVPPFEAIPLPQQLAFVRQLIQLLAVHFKTE